ncbi:MULTISPECIES: hypothetical protein [Nitrospirillum]|uniref:Uncharacterized protein n=1 Tax=Nitrospirillum amazonense TaxID=28077 RepID=A0A560F0N4_9PROT|nr:hypothetical protein [Nitrospirillum amazonense]MEC4595187.1 hypothetical protein [Nitrospirillum amazonense]TWB15169.1 hypothetical protein FBZ88_13110 [Nitrospirillum amazonense]
METAITSQPVVTANRHTFYVAMAAVFLAIAFGGFTPTYWRPVLSGTFHRPAIVHIHGFVLFSWCLFYFAQTLLAARGRTPDHRSWGLAGIALFSVMICTILASQVAVLNLYAQLGYGDAAKRFAAVSLTALPLFIAVFVLAIVMVRRPEVHKRLMILLMALLMQPAIARVFVALLAPPPGAAAEGPPPPPFVAIPPGLVADLLLVVALVHDWRTRGRPHPVYAYGLPLAVLNQVVMVPIAGSATWMTLMDGYTKLFG